jgi:hypothetical protein
VPLNTHSNVYCTFSSTLSHLLLCNFPLSHANLTADASVHVYSIHDNGFVFSQDLSPVIENEPAEPALFATL